MLEERDDLAVVTCLFTPATHARRQQNFEIFSRQFGRSLYVAELAFDWQPWVLPSDTRTFQFRGSGAQVMWQKERLLNALIARLPSQVTHVAWVDADILFCDLQWPTRAIRLLQQYPVIQLFDRVLHAGVQPGGVLSDESVASTLAKHGKAVFDRRRGTPGFAWAARRELLVELPLLDCLILGGADAYMAAGFAGAAPPHFRSEFPVALRRAAEAWAARALRASGGRIGCLSGTIGHMFHGSLKTREYLQRYEILRRAAFDPARDIALDSSGLYAWSTPKKTLHADVAAYFSRRAVAENV